MSSPDLDFDSLREIAESKLPIAALLVHLGYPAPEHTSRWGKCPACERPGKFRAWSGTFKCNHPDCELNPDQLHARGLKANPAGLIALKQGCDWQEASRRHWLWAGAIDQETYERLAGITSSKPKAKPPVATAPPELEPEPEPETEPELEATATEEAPAAEETIEEANEEPATPESESEEEAEPEPEPEADNIVLFQREDDEDDDAPSIRQLNDGNPWHDLWLAMRLSDQHRTELTGQRGLSRTTIDQCGFRTSRPANASLIEDLRKKYEDEDLLEYGILRQDDGLEYKPEPQLCGWGITKEKDETTGKHKFGQTNPVLIPYFDHHGQVITMRAHKGGLPKRLLPGDIEWRNYSHPYGEHFLKHHKGGWCVITEGEIKAAAVQQCGIPCLAVPGITFIQNDGFRAELLRILRRNWIKRVVIIFDNERKDDPKLATFQPDENKRYDVYIWANVIAHKLVRDGIREVKVGQLPDEWQEKGKADFDGILRQCVEQKDGDLDAGTKAAKAIFQRVVDTAAKPLDFIDDLFADRARQIIHSKVVRYTRERQLPIGTEDEKEKAFLFRRDHRKLAEALDATRDCYYIRKNVEAKLRGRLAKELSKKKQQLNDATVAADKPGKLRHLRIEIAILEEQLLGWPEVISNFKLTCLYRVVTEDEGRLEYYCEAYIPLERRKVYVRIPAKPLSRLAEFREFINGRIPGANFQGGEKDLQRLKNDLDVDSAWRTINEVNAFGWHEFSGLFIFGDAAWTKEGRRIYPDKNRVFWHGDTGYQIDSDPNKPPGADFDQGAPLMRPEEPDREKLTEEFQQWILDFRDNVGGMEAWAILGTTIGYLAMPAFFRAHGVQHPGVWLHGLFGEGKTSIARWLARLHGFGYLKGVPLTKATTDAAINRIIQMYSCLMVFFDEYRSGYVEEGRESLLRVSFDRLAISKANMENKRKTVRVVPLTTPIICGETECPDSATRSRYTQVVVTKRRRKAEGNQARFARLNAMAPHLYQIARRLLDQRPDFETAFLGHYAEWTTYIDKMKAIINDRSGVTYGVSYAGFAALVDLLDLRPLHSPTKEAFLPFLVSYMNQADTDNRSSGTVEAFWTQFISAIHQHEIKKDYVKRAHVIPHASTPGKVTLSRAADPNARPVCLINITEAFSAYEEFLRRRGKQEKMSMGNLLKYMKPQPWFAWQHADGWKTKWSGVNRATWGVYLDGEDAFPWADEIDGILEDQDLTGQ